LKKTDYCVEKAERKYFVWRFSQAQFSRRLHFSQKKGIALVLHFSYFFLGDGLKPKKPSRQGSSRGPRGLARVGHSTCEKAETFLAGVLFSARAFSQPAAGGVEKDRPNLSFASRSVGGLDASARSEAPTGTTGSRRVASSIRARSRERAACRASAGTRRATAPIASSSSLHRRTMDAWKRETRGFSSGVLVSDDDARRGVFRTQHEYHVCGVFS